MNDLKRDMMRIQELIGNAFRQTGSLVALTDGGQMNPNKLQKTLEQTMEQFEAATLELRKLCERYAPGSGGFAKKPILPSMDVTGSVEAFGYHLRGRLKGGKTMLLSNQQKYILEILKEFKYLRVRQLHALVQAHYRTQGIKIDERRMEIMLRQMRTGTNYVWLRGDVVSYGDRRIDPRLLEALDVMLELTRVQPGFYSKDGLHEPFLLRFTGNGKGAGYLFSVAWLDAATHIATVPRMKGERIIWISESGSFGEIDLPRHHFFAARQKDGTHRFFGSNEPEKI